MSRGLKSSPRTFRPPHDCTLSAAIAENLALGMDLHDAVAAAKAYLDRTLACSLSWGELAALNQGTTDFR